jgi:hypothetical protein
LITGLTTRYSPFVGALYAQDYSAIPMIELYKKINDFEESTVFKNTHVDLVEPDQGMIALAKDQTIPSYKNLDKDMKCFACGKEAIEPSTVKRTRTRKDVPTANELVIRTMNVASLTGTLATSEKELMIMKMNLDLRKGTRITMIKRLMGKMRMSMGYSLDL